MTRLLFALFFALAASPALAADPVPVAPMPKAKAVGCGCGTPGCVCVPFGPCECPKPCGCGPRGFVNDPTPVLPPKACPDCCPTCCCTITIGGAGGSGTCVWCEEGYSLILTCRHVTHFGVGCGGKCTVTCCGKDHPGQCMCFAEGCDLALVWVKAELPVAKVAKANPKAGTRVHVWGRTTKAAAGTITGNLFSIEEGKHLAGNYKSDSGDSGAGVFAESGELVGVHCGKVGIPGEPRQVASAASVRAFLGAKAGVRFAGVAREFGKDVPAVTAYPFGAPGNCPTCRPGR